MIFFCEDCGEKNILTPEQLKEGKAVFRCESCRYMNSYAIRINPASYLEQADTFSKAVQLFPDVIGSFLFHRDTGVLKNNMPGTLKNADLDILGKILTKNILTCRSQYPDVNEMTLIISNKNMTIKRLSDTLSMIIASKTFPLSKNVMDELALLVSNDTA